MRRRASISPYVAPHELLRIIASVDNFDALGEAFETHWPGLL